MPKLFAVMLGGNCAPRSHTELHDVVFVAGERIEDTWDDLLAAWFGTPDGLHVDSWWELRAVDGHRVTLARDAGAGAARLFFVNLGGYRDGVFAEAHANTFVVAADADEAKARAKASLLRGFDEVHTDDLHDVDDCLEIGEVAGWRVVLEADPSAAPAAPVNGWLPLPEDAIRRFKQRS